MTRIMIIAVGLAFLAAAEKESLASQCGTPTLLALAFLVIITVLYGIARILIFAVRHPS
jgi:hypothetical protein